jgi:carboxyl-terminal processing protease
MEMIKGRYNGTVTDYKLLNGALKGLFGTMDQYTEYFTSEEAREFINTIDGTYEGVGMTLSIVNGQAMVSKVFPGSPSEKAGILAGDVIAAIDGIMVKGMTLEEMTGLTKGKAGSKVKLSVARGGAAEAAVIEVTRGQVSISPVSCEIYGKIGYIRIELFSSNLDGFLTSALEFMDENGITKIVLDLRNNPGGDLSQAVETARKFIPRGVITKVDYRSEEDIDRAYYSYLPAKKYAVAVLVNGLSASASEIVAGAFQDSATALLIGEKTFGKAKVQTMIPLLTPQAYQKYMASTGAGEVSAYDLILKYGIIPSEDELLGYAKITTGQYTTPKGRMIDLKGLIPDIIVPDTDHSNGIYPGSVQKLSKVAKFTLDSESSEVYYAEMILALCGYDIDEPDYRLDKKTFAAIAQFQEESGLYPYGVLDFTTQQYLNDILKLKTLEMDKQLSKAIEILTGP